MSDATAISVERLPRDGDVVVLALYGELVVTNREVVRQRVVAELEEGARTLVLAAGGLSHIDTSGLALLVQLSIRCAEGGGRLAVAELGEFADELRQSLFLDQAVLFADGVEDAVAALSG